MIWVWGPPINSWLANSQSEILSIIVLLLEVLLHSNGTCHPRAEKRVASGDAHHFAFDAHWVPELRGLLRAQHTTLSVRVRRIVGALNLQANPISCAWNHPRVFYMRREMRCLKVHLPCLDLDLHAKVCKG